MFENFKSFMSGAAPLEVCKEGQPTNTDLQLAVTAVLMQVVSIDKRTGNRELETLFLSLCAELDIAESAVAELFEISEFLLNEDSSRLQQYVDLVAQKFSNEQKIRILGVAWKIISADGELAEQEVELLTHLRRDLGLTLEQALYAQQLAQSDAFDWKNPEIEDN